VSYWHHPSTFRISNIYYYTDQHQIRSDQMTINPNPNPNSETSVHSLKRHRNTNSNSNEDTSPSTSITIPTLPTIPVMRIPKQLSQYNKPIDISAACHFFHAVLKSPRYIAAPMVNQSELPYRMMCRRYDSQLCYTPMMHAQQFATSEHYRKTEFTTCKEDRPLILQFCGNDPSTVLHAAKYVDGTYNNGISLADAVDLNLGCPQHIAKRGHYGAYLMTDTDRIYGIINTLYNELSIPVTAKMRIFPSIEQTLHLARTLQSAGCSVLTVHGRTKEQNKQFMGEVDLDVIKRIKEELQIPVVANGGVHTLKDANRILEYTGCDAVMSSEGLLSNPALFSGTHPDSIQLATEYLALCQEYHGADSSAQRGHLFKILHQRLAHNTDLRAKLGSCRPDEFTAIVDELRQRDNVEHADMYSDEHWYMRYQVIERKQIAKKQQQLREKQRQEQEQEQLSMMQEAVTMEIKEQQSMSAG
jgi:tRNA-dihydrouridine synthase 1